MTTVSDIWILYHKVKLSKSTHKSQLTEIGRWTHYIEPIFGCKPISEITTLDIALLRTYLEESSRTLSPQTIYHVLSLFRRIINFALRYEVIQKAPLFDMPKFDNRRQRFLTKQEAQQLLTSLKLTSSLWHDISLFALQTGLRAGELFALRKKDFSHDTSSLYIFDTKNGQTRAIPVNNTARTILHNYTPRFSNQFFFTTQLGKKITQVGKPFYKAVEKTGFNQDIQDRRQKVVFHTLRHTFASWLVQEGVPLYTVGNLLGHKTNVMTQRYAHLANDHIRSAINGNALRF